MKEGWNEERWQRVARLGDGMKKNKYWEREENRLCRVCGWGRRLGSIYGRNAQARGKKRDSRRWLEKC